MAIQRDPRIEGLISKMTIQEKVGQLSIYVDKVRMTALGVNPGEGDGPSVEELTDSVRKGHIGNFFNGIGAKKGRELQRIAVEESRLGIPILYGADVIHGFFTTFPLPLAEAASFEPELAKRTARATAIEATAWGVQWTFAPMVDVARDQRWGRVAEGSGEDVFLGAEFAKARVIGFQGPNLTADDSLLACAKHFCAYGAVSAGMEYNYVDISEATLRDVHFPAFKACQEAGALTFMSAFNDIAGVPASGNRWLMTDVLRGEWRFPGFVVSDFTADMELIDHGYAADERDAAKKAFLAGVDISMQSGLYQKYLPELSATGEVPMEAIDEGVRRVLSVKMAMGLFQNPYRSLDPAKQKAVGSHFKSHDELAREAAKRSIVLLKNDDHVLPLRKSGQRIALIGPWGPDKQNLKGTWAIFGMMDRCVSIEDGLRSALEDPTMLSVVEGSGVTKPIDGGIEAAVQAALQADVVLLAIGEAENNSGESQSRTQIIVPAAQQALAEAIVATKKPVVVILKTGRALALAGAVRNAKAILVAWFLGSQTGPGLADVVFGSYSPSARLPVSFPQDSGQQPYFYSHSRTGRPQPRNEPRYFKSRYIEVDNEALYPFGHGLSYTRFEYGAPTLSTQRLPWDQTLRVTALIRNVGARPGEEVAQLYVHDRVASRVRPVRELKGFQKVHLQAGESCEVSFTIDRAALTFHGTDARPVAEPGLFDVWVSPSCVAGEPVSFELLPGAKL